MFKELEKIYEAFNRLNPDFKLNEDETFTSTFDTPSIDSNTVSSTVNNTQTGEQNSNINSASIVADNKLTVGELRFFIETLKKSKNTEEALAKLKAIGGDVAKLGINLIPVIGNYVGAAMDTAGIFKKLFAPKTGGGNKEPNDFMKLLSIDTEVSVLLDDKIEYAFIDYAVNLLNSLPDTSPVPDFFEKLKEFIKEKYSTLYNLTKS